jgi:hypothetical protein
MKYLFISLVFGFSLSFALAQNCAPRADRVDCHPDLNATEARCAGRGCIWCDLGQPGVPACYFPQDYGYSMVGEPINTVNGYR